MAPEQIVPEGALDARTDIYALGCVAYWLLTGQHVFAAATAVQMLAHHLEARPMPPSSRSGQPIPPRLDAIVLACSKRTRSTGRKQRRRWRGISRPVEPVLRGPPISPGAGGANTRWA
jgi:serine/threonine protein kinase